MTREQWQEAWRLYQSGSTISPDQLVAFLESEAGDPQVRDAVRNMLQGDDSVGVEELDRIGQKIGRYVLTGRLGEGGMGEVYAARDLDLGRLVAVKLLPAGTPGTSSPDRFVHEAKAASSLNHPNIVTIHEVIHSASTLAIVMELVDGAALRSLCGTPLPVDRLLHLGKQIASALSAAHAMGIVHCDIKPENLMVRPDGVAKVMDFGLARDLSISHSIGSSAAGTLRYMSPEQSQGQVPSCASDIFSLGIVLYELSTGKHPFERGSIFETLNALNAEAPAAPSESNAYLPSYWDALILGMLAKDHGVRPSAAEVARVMGGESSSEMGAVSEKGKRKRLRVAGLIPRGTPVYVALIAIFSAVIGLLLLSMERSPSRGLARFTIDLGPDARGGRNITAAVSPDGTRLAYLVDQGANRRLVATRLLAEDSPLVLEGTNGAEDLFFSPDGKWIGFFAEQSLKKISVIGGAAVTLCPVSGSPRGAAWGKDGFVIANLDNSNLVRVPEAGGEPIPLDFKPEDHGEQTWRWPQFLPDGRVLLTGSRGSGLSGGFEDANIEVLNLETGELKLVHRGGYFGRYLPSGHLAYVHQGTLFAVPLDLKNLTTRGAPIPVLDDVAGTVARGSGQLDFSTSASESDIFIYRSGKASVESPELVWIDAAGQRQTVPAGLASPRTPRFSPDGKLLALSSKGDIYVHNLERGLTTPITRNGLRNADPVWTPDGKHIIYSQRGGDASVIWWTRADGSGEPRKLFSATQALHVRSISSDSRRIAFARQEPTTGWDLWTLAVDTSDLDHPLASEPELFLQERGDQTYPNFSPDGKWIAYSSSSADDLTEVYVRAFPGDQQSPTTRVSSNGGKFPLWTPAGKHLLFVDRNGFVMQAGWGVRGFAAEAGEARRWSDVRVSDAGSDWSFEITPDGRRLIALPGASLGTNTTGSVRVTVLLNFFEDLKRRVP